MSPGELHGVKDGSGKNQVRWWMGAVVNSDRVRGTLRMGLGLDPFQMAVYFMAYKWGLLTIPTNWDDPPSGKRDVDLFRMILYGGVSDFERLHHDSGQFIAFESPHCLKIYLPLMKVNSTSAIFFQGSLASNEAVNSNITPHRNS